MRHCFDTMDLGYTGQYLLILYEFECFIATSQVYGLGLECHKDDSVKTASNSSQLRPCCMYSIDPGLNGPLILSIEATFAVGGRTGSPGSVAVGLMRDDENP